MIKVMNKNGVIYVSVSDSRVYFTFLLQFVVFVWRPVVIHCYKCSINGLSYFKVKSA